MNDLSPAGPIQAVEILMESPSLAHMCRTHHAVIRRIQVPPWGRGTPSDPKPPGTEPGVQWGVFLWHCGVTDQHLGVLDVGLRLPEIGNSQGWDSQDLGAAGAVAPNAGTPRAEGPWGWGPWGWVLPAPPAPSLPPSLPGTGAGAGAGGAGLGPP